MTSFIYVIAADPAGPVKIGSSKEPERRLRQLQTGHADPLKLFHTEAISVEGVLLMERIIHRENRVHKRKGEWFNLSVTDAIAEVKHAMIRFEQEVSWRTGHE